MKWRRKTGWIIALAVIAMAIGYGFLPQPVLVDSDVVTRGMLRETIREEGKTRVVERYVVSAPVSGYSQRVELKAGDRVTQGQVLARLEPLRSSVLDPRSRAEAEARLEAARASLSVSEQSVEASAVQARYAESELARMKELYEARTISRERLEQAEADARRTQANLQSARASVEVAQHDLEAAQAALRHSAAESAAPPSETVAVRAPTGGRVLKVDHESEGVVNAGEALLEIGSPRVLEVEVEVLSSDAVKLAPGTRVEFERWGGDHPLEGLVRVVEPHGFTKISALGVEEQRVLVIADFTSPRAEWERLGDGYRVEAVFILWQGDNVLQAPSSALFRYRDGWAAFVVEDGKARRKPVEVGHRSGLTAEIVSGLSQGNRVITHPGNDIDDGTEVRQRTE